MKKINEVYENAGYTNRIIQFGEGNFLRCFVDWQIDQLNEETSFDAGVVVVRPIDSDFPPLLDVQDGLYTTVLRGINESKEVVKDFRVIRSINREIPVYKKYYEFLKLAENPDFRYIVSNTTEAGIAFNAADKFNDRPPSTFPAKLTRLMYERFRIFNGDDTKGFVIIPCELIDYNGEILKEMIFRYAETWNLEEGFIGWLEKANTFCSTLVDRIVTGYPKDEIQDLWEELGYEDNFLVTGEYFHLFVIQGPSWLNEELKLDKVKLNVKIVEDILPYKTRKVGLLNGAHTAMVPVGYLCGFDYVRDCIVDENISMFVRNAMFDEIIPALNMDKGELVEFAEAVLDRFMNPFIHHQLLSISLNSMSKFRTRILPQVLGFREKFGRLPRRLVFSLAAEIIFYRGIRGENRFDLKDDDEILELYSQLWKKYDAGMISLSDIAETVLGYEKNWESNLNKVEGLPEMVAKYLEKINSAGIKQAVLEII